jgi:uncharacterized membrane protein YsdA (DUF1294 family)
MSPLVPLLAIYAIMSLVAFVAMAEDKRRARKGAWRISERSLHSIELLGGFPGSLIGQWTFRHKTRSIGYQIPFWIIVVLHGAMWGLLLFFGGDQFLSSVAEFRW